MSNKRVAVFFGGRSCEHEVSILTAQEAMAVLAKLPGYEVVPVYVTKDGRWLTGDSLLDLDKFAAPEALERECSPVTLRPGQRPALEVEAGGWMSKRRPLEVDVALPLIHGPNGEDGTLQGTLEMLGLPYAGSGVLASALCMDKVAMKRMFGYFDLPQVPYAVITRAEWDADRTIAKRTAEQLGAEVFVKPVRGGSSIGVTFVDEPAKLEDAVELALTFDDEALLERAVTGCEEVNCAVLRTVAGVESSELELVHPEGGFLSYDQKYLQWSKGPAPAKGEPVKGVEGHTIPAPVSDEMRERVRGLAKQAFESCECAGTARVDFLVKDDDVYVNEINTVPGSLAFYLWDASGKPFSILLDEMLLAALDVARRRDGLSFSLDRNLLADIQSRKGVKNA